MKTKAKHSLTISANTLRFADLVSRIAAASDAGFTGIGLRLSDYRDARDAGISDRSIAGMIADAGLKVTELEDNWDWVVANNADTAHDDEQQELLRVAELLGARQLNLASFFSHPLSEIVEGFGRLCDRTVDSGLRIGLEFLPYAQISHLSFAWQIVADADRSNGGVLLDAWHYFRSGSQHEQLARIPVEKISGVQLGDVLRDGWVDAKSEARHHRQLPGRGVGDLSGLLDTLATSRYDGPISVEVFSDALDGMPHAAAARECMSATAEVLQSRARGLPTEDRGH